MIQICSFRGDLLLDDLLMMNWLKAHKIEFAYKNQYFFIPRQIFNSLNQQTEVLLLQNMELVDLDVVYQMIINQVPITAKLVNGLFNGYVEEEYQANTKFELPGLRYSARGNLITLYFKSAKFAVPLDVIWILGTTLRFQQRYYGIRFDYLPTDDGLIYQVLFYLNDEKFDQKILEIRQTKEIILRYNWEEAVWGHTRDFSSLLQTVQKICCSKYAGTNDKFTGMEFIGVSVFMPESWKIIRQVHDIVTGQDQIS